jgi:hypothetical protein
MAVKLGTSNVTLKLGTQSVTGYLGSEIVTATVPGAPTITSAAYFAGVPATTVAFTAPNDGGSPITAYKIYVDGVESQTIEPNDPLQASFVSQDLTGQEIEVSAINAIGEGPKSAPVTVT